MGLVVLLLRKHYHDFRFGDWRRGGINAQAASDLFKLGVSILRMHEFKHLEKFYPKILNSVRAFTFTSKLFVEVIPAKENTPRLTYAS